ncbi:hypothetical protein FEZ18_11140 [Oceanihabitans sp. IOP_32]|nr:hypothetical protein FEZ18_11140 [Oceanihabitans sp. IOP_32]
MPMKYYFKHAFYWMLLFLLSSCKDSVEKTSNKISVKNQVSKSKPYNLDTLGLSVEWTAYKFTNKVAVQGSFDSCTFEAKSTSGTVEKILNKSTLSIPTASVNSKHPIRDFKLFHCFFEAFNTSEIVGTILKAKEGEGVFRLKMNSISKRIPFTYSILNDTISKHNMIRLFTNINLIDFKGEEALTMLNTDCYELYKGEDGVSKLWPDVDVVIKIPIKP